MSTSSTRRYCNQEILQPGDTATRRYCNQEILQPGDTATRRYCNQEILQPGDTATRRYCNQEILQPGDTATREYCYQLKENTSLAAKWGWFSKVDLSSYHTGLYSAFTISEQRYGQFNCVRIAIPECCLRTRPNWPLPQRRGYHHTLASYRDRPTSRIITVRRGMDFRSNRRRQLLLPKMCLAYIKSVLGICC